MVSQGRCLRQPCPPRSRYILPLRHQNTCRPGSLRMASPGHCRQPCPSSSPHNWVPSEYVPAGHCTHGESGTPSSSAVPGSQEQHVAASLPTVVVASGMDTWFVGEQSSAASVFAAELRMYTLSPSCCALTPLDCMHCRHCQSSPRDCVALVVVLVPPLIQVVRRATIERSAHSVGSVWRRRNARAHCSNQMVMCWQSIKSRPVDANHLCFGHHDPHCSRQKRT